LEAEEWREDRRSSVSQAPSMANWTFSLGREEFVSLCFVSFVKVSVRYAIRAEFEEEAGSGEPKRLGRQRRRAVAAKGARDFGALANQRAARTSRFFERWNSALQRFTMDLRGGAKRRSEGD